MKQILVPCDFSQEGTEAYKFALKVATKANLGITVMHAIELPVIVAGFDVQPYAYDLAFQEELKEAASANFNKMKERFGGSSGVTFEIQMSSMISAVKTVVGKGQIEMVIMGTRGSSGFDEMLFGSNTEKVVRFSSVPVLAIRTAPEISDIKKIVFPNRLSLDQTALVERVVDLQKFFNAHLYLLWVNTPGHFVPDSEINGLMREFAHHYKLSNYTLEISNDVNEGTGILGFSKRIGADMIAMGTSGRRGLAHLMQGSIAEDVVNHVNCPIWTFSTRVSSVSHGQ